MVSGSSCGAAGLLSLRAAGPVRRSAASRAVFGCERSGDGRRRRCLEVAGLAVQWHRSCSKGAAAAPRLLERGASRTRRSVRHRRRGLAASGDIGGSGADRAGPLRAVVRARPEIAIAILGTSCSSRHAEWRGRPSWASPPGSGIDARGPRVSR